MKLRNDVQVVEFMKENRGKKHSMLFLLYDDDVLNGTISQDYPASFYEQPPAGSFGKFWADGDPYPPVWGHLTSSITGQFRDDAGNLYEHFEMCLPQDVTAAGMPLETE